MMSPKKVVKVVQAGVDELALAQADLSTGEMLGGQLQTMEFATNEVSVVQVKIIQAIQGEDQEEDFVKTDALEDSINLDHDPGPRKAGKRATRKPARFREAETKNPDSAETPQLPNDVQSTDAEVVEDANAESGQEAVSPRKRKGVTTVSTVIAQSPKRVRMPEFFRTVEERTCKICHKTFDTYRKFTFHAKDSHKPTQCVHCGKSLYSKSVLEKHIWAKHPEHGVGPPPQYPCRFCHRVWASISSRYSHEQTHKQRRYECSVCKQLFFNSYTRNQHQLTHSNEAVRCRFCKRLFESAEAFAEHLQRYHPDDVETHGAGIWNIASTRKARLRGSKVEREIGVMVSEYADDGEEGILSGDTLLPANVGANLPQKGATLRARVHIKPSTDTTPAMDTDGGGDTTTTIPTTPTTPTTPTSVPDNEETPVVSKVTISDEGSIQLMANDLDGVAMHRALIKCQLCEVNCTDSDTMIAHLLSFHPDVLQVKLV